MMPRTFLAIVLCMLGMPLWATQDQWPALYDVTGVAANDTLNIRQSPSPSAPIVGQLGPNDRGVEVIRPNDRHTWGQVNAGEVSGWVSLRFLARQPGQWLGQLPHIRACYGTEPFWGLDIAPDGRARFRTPQQSMSGGISGTVTASGRIDTHAVEFSMDGNPGTRLTGILRLAACNDGMSDRNFGISIDLFSGSGARDMRLLTGCCSLSP